MDMSEQWAGKYADIIELGADDPSIIVLSAGLLQERGLSDRALELLEVLWPYLDADPT